jgi:hypothetical protein
MVIRQHGRPSGERGTPPSRARCRPRWITCAARLAPTMCCCGPMGAALCSGGARCPVSAACGARSSSAGVPDLACSPGRETALSVSKDERRSFEARCAALEQLSPALLCCRRADMVAKQRRESSRPHHTGRVRSGGHDALVPACHRCLHCCWGFFAETKIAADVAGRTSRQGKSCCSISFPIAAWRSRSAAAQPQRRGRHLNRPHPH